MSAVALISGKLQGEPVTRPTRSGGQVTFFKLRVANGAAVEWWEVATFSDTVREELGTLSEGDALAVGATPFLAGGEISVDLSALCVRQRQRVARRERHLHRDVEPADEPSHPRPPEILAETVRP